MSGGVWGAGQLSTVFCISSRAAHNNFLEPQMISDELDYCGLIDGASERGDALK